MPERTFRVWRGDRSGGNLVEYKVDLDKGMVVLDVIHRIQAQQASDLACRWNCKAGKCGSCSMEINGKPKLGCMTRMNSFKEDEIITIRPIKAFPIIKDLVTDVSWNYAQNKRIAPFKPGPRPKDGEYRMYQRDVERVQEFRKCIECYLCQNVCHVLRDQNKKDKFVGPRFMVRLASLEMHPLDTEDRIEKVRLEYGSGLCNITKCCTDVCPEHIHITDNAIIPLKERVVDRFFDPIAIILHKILGKKKS
jgi:succinate dehydrogenase / fumarate reductase, iron-sulfur subunit